MTVTIEEEYIRLDNLLKLSGGTDTGGQAKFFIQNGEVLLNGEVCIQRGRKIRPGDKVKFHGKEISVVKGKNDS